MTMLKTCSKLDMGTYDDMILPTLETAKDRIRQERQDRGGFGRDIRKKIAEMNMGAVSDAVKELENTIEETFGAIRCVVADNIQLYAESFFLLPILRRLEGEMSQLELLEDDGSATG